MIVTGYRSVYARAPRRHSGHPITRHIAAYDGTPGGPPRRPRMADKSLCHVFVAWYPESGEQGRPENATCAACLGKWRKLAEACRGCVETDDGLVCRADLGGRCVAAENSASLLAQGSNA